MGSQYLEIVLVLKWVVLHGALLGMISLAVVPTISTLARHGAGAETFGIVIRASQVSCRAAACAIPPPWV